MLVVPLYIASWIWSRMIDMWLRIKVLLSFWRIWIKTDRMPNVNEPVLFIVIGDERPGESGIELLFGHWNGEDWIDMCSQDDDGDPLPIPDYFIVLRWMRIPPFYPKKGEL